eukprot:TRINITY_DN2066_c0_g1_i3.p1 TRINITY_DN2066_c0_g1~~TRINITY_DN2066_c0_g1_i3.p1  ORF type:complete len:208 (-),score=21.15 TRINITY_DN2066_c0_g1_i3:1264-1887(-)
MLLIVITASLSFLSLFSLGMVHLVVLYQIYVDPPLNSTSLTPIFDCDAGLFVLSWMFEAIISIAGSLATLIIGLHDFSARPQGFYWKRILDRDDLEAVYWRKTVFSVLISSILVLCLEIPSLYGVFANMTCPEAVRVRSVFIASIIIHSVILAIWLVAIYKAYKRGKLRARAEIEQDHSFSVPGTTGHAHLPGGSFVHGRSALHVGL